jgi:hypothetical protein
VIGETLSNVAVFASTPTMKGPAAPVFADAPVTIARSFTRSDEDAASAYSSGGNPAGNSSVSAVVSADVIFPRVSVASGSFVRSVEHASSTHPTRIALRMSHPIL